MLPVGGVFFLSGVAGLLYEVVFAKSLALAFGSTAGASTTVLATYMGGMALGSWIGGRLGRRVADPVRAYAGCELGIAVVCAVAPWTLDGVRALYVLLARGSDPGAGTLMILRVALGSLALLPPTILMGMTLPFLVRVVTPDVRALGRSIGLLYGANTLGAATGALAAGYWLLPAVGITSTMRLAVALDVLAAGLAWRLRARLAAPAVDAPAVDESPRPGGDRALALIGLSVLGIGGALTFALETTYVHLLAVVAGNSAYAFSLMLFAFLLGLALGSACARRWMPGPDALARAVGSLELALAATLLAGVFLWDRMPAWFAAMGGWSLAHTFAGRELIRFAVCCLALVPPAMCIGALYPIAMACIGRASKRDAAATAGRAAAVNTVGNVAGALGGGFLLLPWLGSLRTLHALAALALFLGALALVVARRRLAGPLALALAVLALFVAQPRSFDLPRLASGSNVYFAHDALAGSVIDHAESLDGGLTTVTATPYQGRDYLTLRTNGKFQGNDSGEVTAQLGFALDALLHASGRERALIIGFGTGTTTSVVHRAGFARIDVAELSRDVLTLSDRHFRSVNLGVLSAPDVHAHVTDGRNYLMLTRDRFDLIEIEITSIWFAGAASLYNREFYRAAREHLAPHGVLQQWMQLHHVYPEDVVSILATVRSEFPLVWLYVTGGQGIIIACNDGCQPRPETLARLRARPELAGPIAQAGGLSGLLFNRLLDPAGIDRFLASVTRSGADPSDFLSTDDNLRLEYATPRGNVLDTPYSVTVRALAPYAPPTMFDSTALTAAALEAAP